MSVLALLKSSTTASHQALENSLNLFERLKVDGGYLRLLQQFFTIYEPLEERLAGAVDWDSLNWDFNAERKTPWLREDFAALGVPTETMEAWPRCQELPNVDNLGAAIGCLYVLEGSTLGGQMISKHLVKNYGITPDQGGKFFSGYGEQTGPHWKKFGAWAEALADRHPGLSDQAVDAAQSTFDRFRKWFND